MGFGGSISYHVPAGSIDAAERATFLNLYSGIALTGDIEPPPNINISLSSTIFDKMGVNSYIDSIIGVSSTL